MTPWQIKQTADLIGWTPFNLMAQPQGQGVKWADLGGVQFDDPFFDTTVGRRLAVAGTRATITGLDTLRELAAIARHLEPSCFIFHMSRVGSTLLANALKADQRNLVIAEPAPVNQLLRSPFRHSAAEQWGGWLVGLIAALGQPRHGKQSRYVVKFSSHNILKIDLIRRVFPEVPWMFLYRDPIEVMVSNLARPSGWGKLYDKPQAAEIVLGIPPKRLEGMTRELFYAEVLRSYCEAALTAASSGGVFVNYNQVTPESIGAIAGAFGMPAEAQDLERMQAVFSLDAKSDGSRGFAPDSKAKQQAAPPAVLELCQRLLAEPYRKMERIRLKA